MSNSKRLVWLLAVSLLISIALLVACGTTFNRGSDGLVLVGSQGSALIQTFSFSLSNGSISSVSNSTNATGALTCQLPGLPASMVIDPAGAFAYTIINATDQCSGSTTGILAFKINSDGTTKMVGSPVALNNIATTVNATVTGGGVQCLVPVPVNVPVLPGPFIMDSTGTHLFVADNATTVTQQVNFTCNGTSGTQTFNLAVPGSVSVLSIGNGASLTEVAGSPFLTPQSSLAVQPPNIVALAVTPTIFPAAVNGQQVAECTLQPAPTTEFLYAVDSVNNLLWPFGVDTSTGVLTPIAATTEPVLTDQVPAGVAVDACNRFVYVSDSLTNKVSAYTICNGSATQSSQCVTVPLATGQLVQISGSPFSMPGGAEAPGPIVVDPFGNSVYVLDTNSNQVSSFHISPISGSLTPGNPPVVGTGSQPKFMAIRSDDNWLFVTDFNPPALSQFSITPVNGSLSALPVTTTDNNPVGVAVK